MKKEGQELQPTDAEMHYRSLLEYFKHLVWIVGGAVAIIVGAATYFVGNSIKEVKTDARDLAISEAKARVQEALQQTNLSSFIETTAKLQATEAVDRQVSNTVARAMTGIQEDITSLGILSDAGARARLGIRAGLDEIITLKNTAPNASRTIRAIDLLKAIETDYEKVAQVRLKEEGIANLIQRLPSTNGVDANKIFGVISIIRVENDLTDVASAFLILREKTGVQFQMFDFDAVNQWLKDHPENIYK